MMARLMICKVVMGYGLLCAAAARFVIGGGRPQGSPLRSDGQQLFVGEAGKKGALRGGVGILPIPSGVCGCDTRCVVSAAVWLVGGGGPLVIV